VFGWEFEPWGPPSFYLIHTGDESSPGVQGLMHARSEPRTGAGLNGVEPTFSVDDLDAIIAAVEANGGKMMGQKWPIPTVGVLVRFLDTEGNDIGAMKYETPPHT
jgi:predicted enzyme related to lactoylglutathione lyase